jgi:putative ABC transport system permease protein
VVVALTLALGRGLNATIFGMVDAMFLRPFQFADYERLVVLFETPRGASRREAVAPANYLDWRQQVRSLEKLSAWEWWDAILTGREEPERVQGCRVTSGFFELLGVKPVLGRSFARDEEQFGNRRRVVVGDGLWKRRFGAAPGILGTEILVGGEAHTVVGIAPPGFDFPIGSELWAPLAFPPDRTADRRSRALTVGGKLAGGRSLTAARAEMDLIARQLEHQYPDTNRERGVVLRTLSAAFREDSTVPVLAVLETGALLVLLVACANIAGLLLARGVDRQRELALRTALGASRLHIVRQIVTETVVLGLLASGLALLLARVALDVLRTSIPADMARMIEGWNNLRLDSRLVLLTPVLAIAVGLLVGLIPAAAAFRTHVAEALKEGDRSAVGGRRRQRGRQALVVAEIACALALLVAAGLSMAGGARMVSQPGGFDSARLLRMDIPLPETRYDAPAARRDFAASLTARLEAIPGVERAAMAFVLPASG